MKNLNTRTFVNKINKLNPFIFNNKQTTLLEVSKIKANVYQCIEVQPYNNNNTCEMYSAFRVNIEPIEVTLSHFVYDDTYKDLVNSLRFLTLTNWASAKKEQTYNKFEKLFEL